MPSSEGIQVFKSRTEIVNSMISAWLNRISDARVDADSNFRLLAEVIAQELSGNYLSTELLYADIWPQTADAVSLLRFGTEFNYPVEGGTSATGVLRIEGEGGTFIPAGSQFAAILDQNDPYLFATVESGTIPDSGIADAPVITDAADAGDLTGTFEYAVSFLTDAGETEIGAASISLTVNASQIDVTGISLGGTGTIGRNLYRNMDGEGWLFVVNLADNITTIYTDNIEEDDLGGAAPTTSTAERIFLSAEALEVGIRYNVAAQTVRIISDAPGGVLAVTNVSFFTGGSEPQDYEDYRTKLLQFIANPQSGSPADLKAWVEEVDGIAEATVFVNYNLLVATNGHNTIRVSGPGGIIPEPDAIDAAQAALDIEDLANITNHVATFDPNEIDVEVTVTPHGDYTIDDVTPEVEQAIANYINFVPVGETVYVSGIIDAVFGLAGVVNVTVDDPVADVTSTDVEKPVVGAIVVNEA